MSSIETLALEERRIEEKENDARENTIIPIWSQDLKSDFVCSSKGTQAKSYMLYGQGISLATKRSKRIVRAGRQTSSLLFEISSTSESFGQALAKVKNLSPSCRYQSECNLLHCSIRSLSKGFLDLSKSNKSAVVQPLQTALLSMSETIPSVHEKYSIARQKVINTRSQCLRMKTKFMKGCVEIEAIILESTHDEASKADGRSGKGPRRLQTQLQELLSCEVRYADLVEELNQIVKETDVLEKAGLEALQTIEQHRIEFLTDSIVRIESNQRSAFLMKLCEIEEVTINKDPPPPEINPPTKSIPKVSPFFKKLLSPGLSTNDDEDIGEMEADTLGLPPIVGTLRDEVKGCLRERVKRIQAVRTLSTCLVEDVAGACLSMGQATIHQLHQDGYGVKREGKSESLFTTLETEEGPILHGRWNAAVQSIEALALATNDLATKLRTLREEKFSSFLMKAEKHLKVQSDSNDAQWKLVCDVARNEMRAQVRYELSTMQSEKARVRAKSLDDQPARGRVSGNGVPKMTQGMTKALGNVISILPNGGEKAMKMIGSDARRAIVKTSVDEAGQRESKDKTTWKASLSQKEKSVQFYISASESLVESLSKEDKQGWQEVLFALQTFNTMLQEYHISLMQLTPEKIVPSSDTAITDISTWTNTAKEELALKSSSLINGGISSAMLPVELSMPDAVLELVEMLRNKKQELSPNQGEAKDSMRIPIDGNIISVASKECNGTSNPNTKYDLQFLAQGLDRSLTFQSKREPRQQLDVHQSLLSNFLKIDESPFPVTDSFPCVYWPQSDQGHISRLHPGHLFLTERFFRFYEWGGKKLTVEWIEVKKIAKEKDLNGLFDNALLINSDTGPYFFGSFSERDATFMKIESKIKAAEAKRAQEEKEAKEAKEVKVAKEAKKAKEAREALAEETSVVKLQVNTVEPDAVLEKMKVLLSKSLKNVSIKTFYEIAWSEGQKTSPKNLYKDWLTDVGSKKIQVGDWEYGEMVNSWTKETFSEKRVIRFEFTRKTHLYIGPPVATVVQTHYCKHDDNRCVLQMTVEVEGIPMADSFAVEMRWVATQVNSNDLKVEVGLFVNMKKTTMFAKQIRSGALEDSKPVHVSLFEKIKAVIREENDTNDDEDDDADTVDEAEGEEETTQPTLLSSPLSVSKDFLLSAIGFFRKQPSSTQVTLIVGFGLLTLQLSNWIKMNSIHKEIQSVHRELYVIRTLMERKES